jgi:DMSO/TMAO reductase YedYZ molybdopterin-dependent catalytic subunit
MHQEEPEPTHHTELERREFLGSAALLTLPLLATVQGALPAGALGLQGEKGPNTPGVPGLIIRQRDPENLEYPFASLDRFLTPNDRFYVRNHFAVPTLEAGSWRLRVEGTVLQPLELTLEDLRKMPSRTQVAMLECAGNGRVFLTPAARGVQWELGAVSNAEWTGVPLSAVLERAGVKPGAVDVVLEGADSGELKDPPKPAGAIHFARSLPLSKARKPEVLLAYRMNGAELPLSHGFPLRAVVPGWYGMASVKWLTRLIVTETPFQGHFQTVDYAYWERRNGLPARVPLTEIQVKAAISRPATREVVPAGGRYRVHGAAWAGETEVQRVEISADGGKTWAEAKLRDKAVPYAWRFWDYDWHVPPTPGRTLLMARATDTLGRTQPMQRDGDRENYMITHVLPIEIEVR